ncbi:MBOAT family protein [Aphelenchoides avenae]|nr:MBOAT family protein [Aphelenchus avenae]
MKFISGENFRAHKDRFVIGAINGRGPTFVEYKLGADAVCNLSGLGFNGVDEKGTPKWDLVTNVYPLQYETALSFKDALDSWNITTGLWLRRVAYDRSPKRYRTVATYVLSAVWHGFSVGYYMTFLTAALFTVAARTVRRCIRPHFQHAKPMRLFYHACTFFTTQIFMSYATFPFVTMHLNPGFTVYRQMYFLPHIIAALAIVLLPKLASARRPADPQKTIGARRVDHVKQG